MPVHLYLLREILVHEIGEILAGPFFFVLSLFHFLSLQILIFLISGLTFMILPYILCFVKYNIKIFVYQFTIINYIPVCV